MSLEMAKWCIEFKVYTGIKPKVSLTISKFTTYPQIHVEDDKIKMKVNKQC